jgi:LCP family protein required for cell wall assembly
MSEKKPSRIRRFFGFIAFRLIPLILLIGGVLSGIQVVGSVIRLVNEGVSAGQRADAYVQTATAIATPETAAMVKQRPLLAVPPNRPEQEFITNTPNTMSEVIIPQVNTAVPDTATPFPTPSLTPTPGVSSTPPPLPTLLMPGNVAPQIEAPTAIPTQVNTVPRNGQDILNVLLMGNDGELTDDGFIRTDTMIIVSINRTAGTVGMLSVPRDLYVYMPGWSMNRINIAYTYGESAGWTDGGFGLMRETLFYNLGVNVHYYAMVDLSGFKEIIDTLGGIDVAVDCALQDLRLVGAEVPAAAYVSDEETLEYILPVGFYHLNGAEALWYSRSRGNSSDFDRGRRQQQVLRAVWRQARDTGLLEQLPELWGQGMQLVETNMPVDVAVSLMPIALELDTSRMEQFTMRRTYDTIPWQTPAGDYVQLPVYENILELLNDLYFPPTENQIISEGAQMAVYNGTTIPELDRVAAERLGWDGFAAIPVGVADNTAYTNTILIDYTGATKGSSLNEIARVLNVTPDNIRVQPDPNRTVDFEVILGSNYNSCTHTGVLPVEE